MTWSDGNALTYARFSETAKRHFDLDGGERFVDVKAGRPSGRARFHAGSVKKPASVAVPT